VDAVVVLSIGEDGTEAERVEELAQVLRAEILEAGVGDVAAARDGVPPPGSRAVDVAAAGGLLVTISGSVDVLHHLMGVVRGWLGRAPAERAVELSVGGQTLRLSNASADQQERLVEVFVRAVAGAELP
jgi:hypothetical protein